MKRRNRKKHLTDVMMDIYRALYANAEPKADFDQLVSEALIDDEGKKIIPYENYEIDGDLMDKIVDNTLKHEKLTDSERSMIRLSVYLGCGPNTKSKIKHEENSENETR